MSFTENNLVKSSRYRFAQAALMLGDVSALCTAIALAFALRFEGTPWHAVYAEHIRCHVPSLPMVIAAYLIVFSAYRLYRYAWRFASLEMVWGVMSANTIGVIVLVTIQLLMEGRTFPRSVLAMTWILSICMVGGVRILLRLAGAHRAAKPRQSVLRAGEREKGAVILGGGAHAARMVRAIREDLGASYRFAGVLDDDPLLHGSYIGSVRVLGPLRMLRNLLDEGVVGEVIVALADTSGKQVREHILECRKRKVPVKVIPRMRDVLSGKAFLRLEEFSVEDLLRRPPVRTDMQAVGDYLTDKSVLVTGAGGSIGSEICRQVLAFGPSALVMLGHGEHSIFQARQDLLREFPSMSERVHWAIASVAHRIRMEGVFGEYRPDVVFHAAAHKHVPIMEANVHEAICNNVLGTWYVAQTCRKRGAKRMVLISTDKAANPGSVMGATKRLGEEIMRASASLWPEPQFVSVRFGNVLGSRGSVVPLFHEQIKRGGPVTVTHPEMTRYFMTIPEAVELVLQAGITGRTGHLYLLDMGEPVRILDLARDMIRLLGFEPEVDVPIAITGVRPGERLHERLVADCESLESMPGSGLSIVRRPERFSPTEMTQALERLERAVETSPATELRSILYSLADDGAAVPDAQTAVSARTYPAMA